MRTTCTLALLVALRGTAGAQVEQRVIVDHEDPDRPILRGWRVPLVIAETAATLIPPTIYYWNTTSQQREDWEMDWTWGDWKRKLTSLDALAFDTGYWEANAIRHPIGGALDYQVARANGFGIVASTAVDLAGSVVWEYLVEFKERPSTNDLITNSISGFLLGEPLFELGRAARGSWARQAMGWIVSPVDRLHSALHYGSWPDTPARWTSFEAGTSAGASAIGDGPTSGEAAMSFDLELVGDRRYGATGDAGGSMRASAWNRAAGEVRLSRDGLSDARLTTSTIYGGWYARTIDDAGDGADLFVGAVAGLDYESRRLSEEWDHELVLHLAGPRLALGRWHAGRRVIWEVAGYADLAMIQAHVFGPVPPFQPMPQLSVLQARGYYYATGATLASRVRLDRGRWFGALELRVHQLWSIDGLDRIELGGGPNDPHDVTDQRAHGRAAVGLWTTPALRVELAVDGALRRGAWQSEHRATGELGAHAGVAVGF